MNPYFASENEIYFTDGLFEVLIDTFVLDATAEKVCKLLNDAYKDAYRDGMNASLHEKHKELIDKVTSLTIQNMKLKDQLK